MTKDQLDRIRKHAENIAFAAGEQINRTANSLDIVVQKERMDVATVADIRTEDFIKSKLHTFFPDHEFYAEEAGGEIDSHIPTWIIDPIDGTKEFVRDIPIFCTTFCLTLENEFLVSVVYNPRTKELFSAARGCGAYKDGKKVNVTKEGDIAKAHLFFRLPDYSNGDRISYILSVFEKLVHAAYRVRGVVNQNIALCWVGMGGYDGYVNVSRSDNPWDYAAGSLFLEEAGGLLQLLTSKNLDVANVERTYIAANPVLCDRLKKTIVK